MGLFLKMRGLVGAGGNFGGFLADPGPLPPNIGRWPRGVDAAPAPARGSLLGVGPFLWMDLGGDIPPEIKVGEPNGLGPPSRLECLLLFLFFGKDVLAPFPFPGAAGAPWFPPGSGKIICPFSMARGNYPCRPAMERLGAPPG